MTIDSVTGQINWENPIIGQHQVVITVGDGQSTTAQGYTLTVRENQLPVIDTSNPPPPTANINEEYRYDVNAIDPNGDNITYTLDDQSISKGI